MINTANPIDGRLRRHAGIIALLSVVIGVACAVFAVLGSTLMPTIDTTRAMQIGLAAGALASIPVLYAVARLLAARRPRLRTQLWCGILLVALDIVWHAVATLTGALSSGDLPWPPVILAAVGIGVVTFALLRTAPSLRWLLSSALVLTALIPLWGLLVMGGFIAPFAAVGLAIWCLHSRKSTRPTSGQFAQIS
ncbi:hypothetical protein [Microbacterium esteraromaticum]|uniref:hypothetical protein n=1 Tax=Microbacterium esteraromaticum TaxID=57043 RepID=UPI000B362943|nr:hypothetical protein [Microbacterium esteraromaticum]